MTTRSIIATTTETTGGFAAGGGKVTTDLGGAADMGRGIVVQSDGKILVAGYALTAGAQDFGVVRYNVDGTLDTSFAGDGLLTTDFGGNDLGYKHRPAKRWPDPRCGEQWR